MRIVGVDTVHSTGRIGRADAEARLADTRGEEPEAVLEELLAVEEEHVGRLGDATGGLRVLQAIRVGVEAVTSATGWLSWLFAWVVFALGLFNVITRYVARFIERDIIIAQVFDLQWMVFGALFLLALNYGVREGVNPRIDFWWADFPPKRKARIDLAIHAVLFFPFCWLAVRILWPWTMTALGRNFDGSWDTWKVWEIWEQSGDAGGLPRGPIKLIMLIGFFLLASQIVGEMIKNVFVLLGREDLANLAEQEAPLRVE